MIIENLSLKIKAREIEGIKILRYEVNIKILAKKINLKFVKI
jgi:hypothetical protein